MTPQQPDAASSAPGQPPVRAASLNVGRMMSEFNVAFSLMSVIPLLTCFYLITARFFSIEVLVGINGVFFLLALVIALLGLLAGHQLIRRIVGQLMQANAKLAKLNEAQGGFVSNVAHEFRAPLAVFKGALDNLADGLHGELAPDQQEPVIMCQKEVNRLTRLVRDLLELAASNRGNSRSRRRSSRCRMRSRPPRRCSPSCCGNAGSSCMSICPRSRWWSSETATG